MYQPHAVNFDPLVGKGGLNASKVIGLLALFGIMSGVVLALAGAAFSQPGAGQTGQGSPGSDLPAAVFLGAPAALAAGWAMLALWYMGSSTRIWVAGGIVAALFALFVAAAQRYTPNYGFDPQVAWALAGGEAFVAGVWLTDLFTGLNRRGVTIGLAADLWMLILFLPWFGQHMPFIYPFVPTALIVAPLLAIATASLVERRKPRLKRLLQWLAVGFLMLPVALIASLYLARAIFPW